MLDNLVNNLNDGSNTEVLAEARRIYTLNNNILGLRKRKKGLNRERNLLKNQL